MGISVFLKSQNLNSWPLTFPLPTVERHLKKKIKAFQTMATSQGKRINTDCHMCLAQSQSSELKLFFTAPVSHPKSGAQQLMGNLSERTEGAESQ